MESNFRFQVNEKRIDATAILFLVIISAVLLFNNLSGETVPYYDEPYYSYVDLEAYTNSTNLFLPDKSLELLYQKKPPLKTWIQYPLLKIFGYSITVLRLPDVIMGILTIVFIYLIGKFLHDWRTGLIAGVVVLTTEAFITNWARSNLYDAGFNLSVIMFFYFFLRYYEKKLGYLMCALPLAAAFYFKHIQAIIPIGLIGLFLILSGQYKKILTLKFWKMIGITAVLFLAWAVPFAIHSPDFLKFFFDSELKARIVTGHFNATRSDYLYYIKSLQLLGWWIALLVPALVYTIYRYIKTRDKFLLFIINWIFPSIILLSIAQSKLDRYIYFIYPAFGLMIGYMVSDLYKKFRWYENMRRNMMIPFLIVATVAAYQYADNLRITNNYPHKRFHIYNEFHQTHKNTKVYAYKMKLKDLTRPEAVHLHSLHNVRWIDKNLDQFITKLRVDDSLIISRKTFLELLYNINYNSASRFENTYFFNYSDKFEQLIVHQKMKVVLFHGGGELEVWLKEKGIEYYPAVPIEQLLDFSESDDGIFFDKMTTRLLGYVMSDDYRKDFLDFLSAGIYTRKQLFELFKCYALTDDYHYKNFYYDFGMKYLVTSLHPYNVLGNFDNLKNIKILGIPKEKFRNETLCEIQNTINEATWDENELQYEKLISRLEQLTNDSIIITRRDLLIRILIQNKIPESITERFLFCNFHLPTRALDGLFVQKVIIVAKNSAIYMKLQEAGAHFYPIKNIASPQFQDYNNSQFIKRNTDMFFNGEMLKKYFDSWMKKLSSGKATREEIYNSLKKQALTIRY
ncbi:MAG: glycosyltransferase family 39 protein [Acidobacteria bacterium]|nr:glycosyltransferase family 39 protein [Acidobacteriota bacterium]